MSIGDLRERVTLQAKHRATDGGGGFSESWSDVATVWASLDWSPGGEALHRERTVVKKGWPAIAARILARVENAVMPRASERAPQAQEAAPRAPAPRRRPALPRYKETPP